MSPNGTLRTRSWSPPVRGSPPRLGGAAEARDHEQVRVLLKRLRREAENAARPQERFLRIVEEPLDGMVALHSRSDEIVVRPQRHAGIPECMRIPVRRGEDDLAVTSQRRRGPLQRVREPADGGHHNAAVRAQRLWQQRQQLGVPADKRQGSRCVVVAQEYGLDVSPPGRTEVVERRVLDPAQPAAKLGVPPYERHPEGLARWRAARLAPEAVVVVVQLAHAHDEHLLVHRNPCGLLDRGLQPARAPRQGRVDGAASFAAEHANVDPADVEGLCWKHVLRPPLG
mmetsp:Transcript_96819/g.271021  ORF Transcript_96819/g.271021 Transcript_96819/m.271021 type:complete len:284 (-) Transcript_96819:206-1057(-)